MTMQRSTTFVLALLTLSGCAMQAPPQAGAGSGSGCDVATVPSAAVFGVRDGIDIATYPSEHPSGFSGCQRVWYGDRQRPQSMKVLATYYYDQGQVRRLVGQVPGGQAYDCRYRDGTLDQAGSRNLAVCPDATRLQQLPLGSR